MGRLACPPSYPFELASSHDQWRPQREMGAPPQFGVCDLDRFDQGSRKQDIVFQVNVNMGVGLQVGQPFVE